MKSDEIFPENLLDAYEKPRKVIRTFIIFAKKNGPVSSLVLLWTGPPTSNSRSQKNILDENHR